jgi:hypothetical protein
MASQNSQPASALSRLNKLSDQLSAKKATDNHSPNHAPYQITEEPLGTTRQLRIVGVGAGMSGMNMIRTLRLHLKDYEHVVYEKNPVLGGTWYENRYPGCKCDVPSHNYQFSWRHNYYWKGFFSTATEIQAYLRQVAEEENMTNVIKTGHQIERAEWDELSGKWHLKVRNLQTDTVFEDECDFLLDSSGILKYVYVFRLFLDVHGNTERLSTYIIFVVIGSGRLSPDCTPSRASWFTAQTGPRISAIKIRRLR